MSFEGGNLAEAADTCPYPGDGAKAGEVLELADAYRAAAEKLFESGLRGNPFRWTSIHAIELYLNAALLDRGMPAGEIRSHFHDLAIRGAFLRFDTSIKLREGTRAHLIDLTRRREYLSARYDLDVPATFSQPTRLQASLQDVATKVSKALKPS